MTTSDLTLYGATGFVGRITARHLAQSAPAGLRIAMAGRSLPRLEALQRELGPAAAHWQLVTASAEEPEALHAMAESTRVVATTVGPYAKWGMPLVEACARGGTDYCDLTGELLFVRDSIRAWHGTAVNSGARIVHSCGFDSIPSDLGVLVAAAQAKADGAGEFTQVRLAVESMRGGFSGGTIDSFRNHMDVLRADPQARAAVRDPDVLSGVGAALNATSASTRTRPGGPRRRWAPVRRHPQTGQWTGPFMMGGFNARIVRRSNALLGGQYGSGFRYSEVVDHGSGPTAPVVALTMSAGWALLTAGLSWRPTRALLDQVLPRPGTGPTEHMQRTGHFRMVITAHTTSGTAYRTVVSAAKDPGYGATAVMFGQSALCLALDGTRLPRRAGVLTPAAAMGLPLVDRLRAAGMTFQCERIPTGDLAGQLDR
ncbi:MAG: saccharopine dehydrogenase family protein [Dermatophilaceae bacterium]